MYRLLALGLLVLAACTSRAETDDIDDMDTGITDWSTQLAARAGSDIRGSANVQTVVVEGFAGTSAAAVSIGGAMAGARHPWHVHSGSCGSGGPIVGDPSAYPVLNVGADGNASASANLAVGLNDDADYHVNVHRSPSDPGTIVACGDLVD